MGGIHTTSITNKLDGKILTPKSGQAFVLHLVDGTKLSASDFRVTDVRQTQDNGVNTIKIQLSCSQPPLSAELIYTLQPEAFFLRKQLTLTPEIDLAIANIDLESMQLDQAYQPYTLSQITAQGPSQWRPGLGQPLYTKTTGSFWGIEFPAAAEKGGTDQ